LLGGAEEYRDYMIRNILVDSFRKGALVVILGLLAYSVAGLAQSSNPVKWTQQPDVTGWDVNMTIQPTGLPVTLADDFKCTQTGLITDVHLWTSYHQTQEPVSYPYNFTISIWSDIPSVPGATPYSQPGQQLWSMVLTPSSSQLIQTPPEGWFDPSVTPPVIIANDHVNMWKYDFTIPDSAAFPQTAGNIYWLSVQAVPLGTEPQIGWKNSTNHWNDDAVFKSGTAGWQELRDPRTETSMDLAFELTTTPSVPDGGANVLLLGLGLVGLCAAKRFIR
jgi:hypothetical protein